MLLLIILSVSNLISSVKCQTVEYPTVNCITIEGSNSGPGDDDESRINCNTLGSTYTMTSCTVWSAWGELDGTFIDSNGDCVAVMGGGAQLHMYVKAVAQCCVLDPTINCMVRQGTISGTKDDDESVVYCQSNEYLTGCSVITSAKNIDGAKPDVSSKKCTAINGEGGQGVNAEAQCCSYTPNNRYTVELECYHSQAGPSGTADGDNAEAECYSHFISGCSGWNDQPSLDSWRIENNKCIATNKAGGIGVYAFVICCAEKKTYLPTKHPTFEPTSTPSQKPTFIPTSTPTRIPTIIPTTNPTRIPTFIPTTNPTRIPTFIPTTNPTFQPTIEPTVIPTSNPATLNPTSIPTAIPTMVPTSSPTTSNPTEKPVEIIAGNPTVASTEYNPYTTNDEEKHSSNEGKTAEQKQGERNSIIALVLIVAVAILFTIAMIITCGLLYSRKIKPKQMKTKNINKLSQNDKRVNKIEIQAQNVQQGESASIHSQSHLASASNILEIDENKVSKFKESIDNIDNNEPHGDTFNRESMSSSSDEASLLFQTQNVSDMGNTSDIATIGSTTQISNDMNNMNNINNMNVQIESTLQGADV